jgi:hypothetical protein
VRGSPPPWCDGEVLLLLALSDAPQ